MRRAWITFPLASALLAGSAVLHCTADGSISGNPPRLAGTSTTHENIVLLSFRTSLVEEWTVESASLFLHVREGAPAMVRAATASWPWSEEDERPPALRGLAWKRARVTRHPENWIQVHLPPDLAQDLVRGPAKTLLVQPADRKMWVTDARETLRWAPYLIVEGRAGGVATIGTWPNHWKARRRWSRAPAREWAKGSHWSWRGAAAAWR